MFFRKNILILFIVLTPLKILNAQDIDSAKLKPIDISKLKFYYQLGLGPNFSSGIGSFSNYSESNDGTVTQGNKLGSFGKGFDISFLLGKKVAKNFGIEMEIGYLIGGKNKEENQFYVTSFPYNYNVKQELTYNANTFRINPKFVLEIPIANTSAFYCKLGYMIGFGKLKIVAAEEAYYENGQKGQGNYEWERLGGIVSGSTTAFGFRFKVEKDVSFFIEVTGNSLHRKFEKSIMTQSIENGQNTLATRSVYSKNIVYEDKSTSTSSPDFTRPRSAPSFRSNYSSVGFKLGFVKHF